MTKIILYSSHIIFIIFLILWVQINNLKTLKSNIKYKTDITKNYIILNKKDIKLHSEVKKNKKVLILNKKIHLEKNINCKITSNIKITNNEIFINANDNKIISFNIKKNKIKWQTLTNVTEFSNNSKSKLLISCNKIYQIVPNLKLIILNKNTGEILVNKNIKIDNTNTTQNIKIIKKSIINKNFIYMCYTDGSFIKLDGTTGNKIWQKTKNNYTNFLILKNKLIIIKNNGNITFLNKKNGKKILTNRSLYGKKIDLINIKNIILIKENNEIIHILNVKTGLITSSFKINDNKINYV